MDAVLQSINWDYLLRICLAALLTGLIGIERNFHGRPAGFRTHVLVGIGACVFTIISQVIAVRGNVLTDHGIGINDPGRIAAQVVTGIGFLGAGTIIKFGINIKGLTTAACLWIVAAIGMAAGAGMYFLAVSATALSLISLLFLKLIEYLIPNHSYRTLIIVTDINTDPSDILPLLKGKGVKIKQINFDHDYRTGTSAIKVNLRLFHAGLADQRFHSIQKALSDADINIRKLVWTA